MTWLRVRAGSQSQSVPASLVGAGWSTIKMASTISTRVLGRKPSSRPRKGDLSLSLSGAPEAPAQCPVCCRVTAHGRLPGLAGIFLKSTLSPGSHSHPPSPWHIAVSTGVALATCVSCETLLIPLDSPPAMTWAAPRTSPTTPAVPPGEGWVEPSCPVGLPSTLIAHPSRCQAALPARYSF